MESNYVLVIARHTEVEGSFSYDAYPWGTGPDGKACYVGADYAIGSYQTQRIITFVIRDDLSWNMISDCIYDYRCSNCKTSPFESPEIASDDVGNDMLEVALATAFPEAYSDRNRKLEREVEEQRRNSFGYRNPLGMHD